MGMGCQHLTLATVLLGQTQYHLFRRLGWPQGQSGWVLKISPPPGFDLQTVHSIESRFTNWVIPKN
jgi:hypothetical protein